MNARTDYFLSPDRVEALRVACESWRGTPFRQASNVKGVGGGVDCSHFVPAVFLEIGAIDRVLAQPRYEVNHAEHSSESLLRAFFDRPEVRERVRSVDESEPHLDGDMVFPRVGLCEHHLGLRFANGVYHVARPSGVCLMAVRQLKLHRSRYRLLAP